MQCVHFANLSTMPFVELNSELEEIGILLASLFESKNSFLFLQQEGATSSVVKSHDNFC